MPPNNHPVPSTSATHHVTLDRRQRREVEAKETSAAMAHHELQLRREYVQAEMIADTCLAQTAAACVAGSAGFNAVLRAAAPEASAALAVIEAVHANKLAQRLDTF